MLISVVALPSVKAQKQDSILFIPVFYKQCNNRLVQLDSLEIILNYYQTGLDENDGYYSRLHTKVSFSKIPDFIKIPANAENIDIYINESIALEANADENNIWRDTFYIENTERFFRPTQEIYTECGEITDDTIIRYTLTGEVSEIAVFDSGKLLSVITYNSNGYIDSEKLNIHAFDSSYSVKKYLYEDSLVYYQTHAYTLLNNPDGKPHVELFHPLPTKKQVKKYRKKLTRTDYKEIRHNHNPNGTLIPVKARVYYPNGKIKLEAEYLVPLDLLKSDKQPLAILLAYEDEHWWYKVITIKRILYDEQGGFILQE